MFFRGWQKQSLIEWPGKISTVVFMSGCNFSCPWCYNRDLVLNSEYLPKISEKEVLEYLNKNKDFLDALVVTGGEPTILFDAQGAVATERREDKIDRPPNPPTRLAVASAKRAGGEGGQSEGLLSFIKKVKAMDFGVGIETNGSNPEALEYLLKNKLVDYLAMDVKAPLGLKSEIRNPKSETNSKSQISKYQKLAGVEIDLEKIKKSIKIIINSGIDYEFRTTVVPGLLTTDDIKEIAQEIKGAKRYILQKFRPENTLLAEDKISKNAQKLDLNALAREINPLVKCSIRA